MRQLKTRLTALVMFPLLIAFIGLCYRSNGLAASQTNQIETVYIPIVHIRSSMPVSDLRIVHLGLFQSVQNANNGVSLVAGKPAMLRVFAQDLDHGNGVTSASVTVRAFRDGSYLGSVRSGPQPVSIQPATNDLNTTFNFELPTEWLNGQLKLITTIDEMDEVSEVNETNNDAEHSFIFRPVAPLDLTIVPIIYTDTRTGVTYHPALTDPVSEWLRTAYPLNEINVSIHAPYAFSGDLSQPEAWQLLLERLTALWTIEVGFGSPHLYLGVIPANGPEGSWFQSGVSGLGWLGYRVSLAVDFGEGTAMTAAHEIGHNFGRRHAPCGNPNNVDPHYPYPDGSIGVFGVDTLDVELLNPDQTRDFMSYCGPEWVSDYTYEALFQDQLNRSGRIGQKESGYFLRASLNDDRVSILPTYTFDGLWFPSDKTSQYQVRIINADGSIAFTHSVGYLEAEEHGTIANMLIAHLDELPDSGQLIQFVSDGQVLATTPIGDRSRFGSNLQIKVTTRLNKVMVRWSDPDTPAMVRFLPQGSESWNVLAIDQFGGSIEFDANQFKGINGLFEVTLANGGESNIAEYQDGEIIK